MSRRILVVDDEQGIRDALSQLLEYEGYEVRAEASGAGGIAAYEQFRPQLVFLDVKMAGMDGLETLRQLRALDPAAIVVMISGHATIQNAVEATQGGAYDIMEKPLDTDRILVTLRNAIGHLALREENARLREVVEQKYEIVGRSHAVRALIETIDRVAATDARVLITGENGTGKELVARALHRQSRRAAGPFVEVNCAAIPSELIESELFGHMKGSFTGAVQDRAGKFEQASGGTLFLDEVGDMSLAAQPQVLRVLAATNKRLEEEIAEGRFREDLYYRLNVVPVVVPALRERRDDIPVLIQHFLDQFAPQGSSARGMERAAADRLAALEWPGNVRELRNTVERLLILSRGPQVTVADVERLVAARTPDGSSPGGLDACRTFEEFKLAAERAFLLVKLREHDWNVAETARALDMPRSNLYKKIERHALAREQQ
ncbi:MAG: sigma-54-dependent Fis family transcriptional regulator [Gemmatimonadetes bacterium]|nr:sigma-54-dependent Fis family transcriptional regulator [Gemmatimonadota bacterium]